MRCSSAATVQRIPCCIRLPARAAAARRPRVAARAAGGGDAFGGAPQADLLLPVCPVPKEQQPIFQLRALQEDSSFDLARQPLPQFSLFLAKSFGGFFLLMGLPVSCFTFDLATEPAQCILSAAAGSLFVVTVLVWRMFLGWDHVGSRLQAAVVEYEETGWYDGQKWVKTPEVLARDRLAVAYEIRPAVARLKSTLLGLGGALATSVLLLAALPPPQAQSSAYPYEPPARATAAPGAAASALEGRGYLESRSYEDRVREYEPWAADDGAAGADAAGARPSLLQHMQSLQ